MQTPQSWVIGSSPECDIVINRPNVSGQHCRLVKIGDNFFLDDMQSTNGTYVNGTKVTSRVPISQSDNITLASDVTMPWPTVSSPSAPVVASAATTPGLEAAKLPGSINPMVWAGIGLLAVLMLLGVILWKSGNQTIIVEVPPAPPVVPEESEPKPEPITDPETPEPAKTTPEQAVYSVLIQNVKSEEFQRLGTAFAISEHHLMTTGMVATFIKREQANFPQAQVQSSALGKTFDVNEIEIYPAFQEAFDKSEPIIQKLRENLDLANKQENAKRSKADQKKIAEQIKVQQGQLFLLFNQQISTDVAILQVKETLPVQLPLAEKMPVVNSSISILGIPFPHKDSGLYAKDSLKPTRMPGAVYRIIDFKKQQVNIPDRFLLKAKGNHATHNWRGSPILDAENRVVGVYSQPAPPVERDKPPPPDLCEAVTVEQIHKLLKTGN